MIWSASGDRREVSFTLEISNGCEPNESRQTNIRKPSVCPQFPSPIPCGRQANGGQFFALARRDAFACRDLDLMLENENRFKLSRQVGEEEEEPPEVRDEDIPF